jgi:2'-5' RNA ligase
MSGFLRLFIALAVPPEVRREIARAQDQLRRRSPPGAVRWTQPEQFHVTLKFLGDVPAAEVEALNTAVAAACAGFPALKLCARGVGFFPNADRPRVLWAGAEDDGGRLAGLHRRLEEAVGRFAPPEKPERFSGHITLGRFKPGHLGSLADLRERAARLRDRPFGGWPSGGVELVRSELTADGARHTVWATFPLGPG